jgi:hypothetical protein
MRITTTAFLLFLNYLGLTQNVDLGLSVGGSNYSGDLTENAASSIKQTHPCIGFHGRIELDPVVSLKLQYMFLKVSGDDKYAERPGNKLRQLSFQSDIHELNFICQMQILNLWSERVRRLNPYIQFGASVFKFNPEALYHGDWIELQPLGTEGQGIQNFGDKYKLTQFALDLGFGLRYFINSKYSLTIDALARHTTTDYLDDASTNYVSYDLLLISRGKTAAELGNKIQAATGTKRANPGDKDWFQSLVFTISYHFGNKYQFRSPRLGKYQILCPRF